MAEIFVRSSSINSNERRQREIKRGFNNLFPGTSKYIGIKVDDPSKVIFHRMLEKRVGHFCGTFDAHVYIRRYRPMDYMDSATVRLMLPLQCRITADSEDYVNEKSMEMMCISHEREESFDSYWYSVKEVIFYFWYLILFCEFE